MPGFCSRGLVPTGGPTASRACENWRVPGAGAAPNPDGQCTGFSTGSWRHWVFPRRKTATIFFCNPLPSAAPDPLAGHQDLPQYYVEVETILCGLQMIQMSCIEQTLVQTMLKNKSIQTMLKMLRKKKSKKAGASIPRLLACFALKGIPRKNRRPHQPRVSCVG